MIKLNRFILTLACSVVLIGLTSVKAHAITFLGLDGLKVELAAAPDLGDNVYLIRVVGVESKWADKVFAVEKVSASGGDRYKFTYEIELSSGPQEKQYYLLTSAGGILYEGSYVDAYNLYLPENRNEPLVVRLDPDAGSVSVDLKESYAAAPYAPKP
jgi:hypothetical protein